MKWWLLSALLATSVQAQELPAADIWSLERKDLGYETYAPQGGGFTCDLPAGWTRFMTKTPRGIAAHAIGPELAGGAVRAAYHIHLFEQGKPGYQPIAEYMKASRQRAKSSNRQSTAPTSWRVNKGPARVFEVREDRMLPVGKLPSQITTLHHFYALVPLGRNDYFVVKLSTTEESYLEYREEFRRLLKTFRVNSM
jgi:hypothetical protein